MELVDFLVKYLKLENVDETEDWVNSLCPTHSERRRSFGVHKKNLVCKCYVCGKKPLHKLLQEVRSISKVDALNLIRNELNKNYKDVKGASFSKKKIIKATKERVIRDLGEELRYYSHQYSKYFTKQKGFDKKILKQFEIFYNDEDKRILFPVRENVTLVGMMYRNPFEEGDYWYNDGFIRQNYVYGIDYTVRGLVVIIVESPKDVAWLYQAGINNAVAIFGTNYGKEQIKKIKNITRKVCIVMDSDDGGRVAQRKLFKEFKDCVKYEIDLDGYKDPGDMPLDILKERFRDHRLCFKV